jgi:hypothetical protein
MYPHYSSTKSNRWREIAICLGIPFRDNLRDAPFPTSRQLLQDGSRRRRFEGECSLKRCCGAVPKATLVHSHLVWGSMKTFIIAALAVYLCTNAVGAPQDIQSPKELVIAFYRLALMDFRPKEAFAQ